MRDRRLQIVTREQAILVGIGGFEHARQPHHERIVQAEPLGEDHLQHLQRRPAPKPACLQ
jgi:hypothetical protein